jgi:hypothetical protein
MKTKILNKPLCEKEESLLSHLLLQLQSLWQSILTSHSLHVNQDFRTGLVAFLIPLKASVTEVVTNQRHAVGIIFLLVIAPLSSVAYQLFDPSVRVDSWYYANNYYFFFVISNYLMLAFASVGIFLLFPQKYKTSYLATVWPLGYALSKLIFYSFFVNSNEQFHQGSHWVLLLSGLFIAIGLLLSADYLAYRKYHLKDGNIARWKGIIAMKGISAEDKMRLLENQSLELENFNQRY